MKNLIVGLIAYDLLQKKPQMNTNIIDKSRLISANSLNRTHGKKEAERLFSPKTKRKQMGKLADKMKGKWRINYTTLSRLFTCVLI